MITHTSNLDYTVERLRSKGLMTDWLKENRETNMACRFIFPENVDGQPRNQNLNKFGEATAVLRDDGTVWMEVRLRIRNYMELYNPFLARKPV